MDEYYLQVKGFSGNSLLWWKKDRHGYTTNISQAHVFTKDEAYRQHALRPTVDIPWGKDYIDAQAELHVNSENVNRADIGAK
jgi:hypothetical protein